MFYSKLKSYNLRLFLFHFEFFYLILKLISFNEYLSRWFRLNFFFKLQEKYNLNYRSKINNQCNFSYHYDSVYRVGKLYRSYLKVNIEEGFISGFKKSSW